MSSNFKYTFGLGNVGSYQTSGVPYFTSSLTIPALGEDPLEIAFPSVSKFVVITNTLPGSATNVPLRFGAAAHGVSGSVNNNFGILNNGESYEGELRMSRLYLLSDNSSECSASVIAGLTRIGSSHLKNNWSGSAGVG